MAATAAAPPRLAMKALRSISMRTSSERDERSAARPTLQRKRADRENALTNDWSPARVGTSGVSRPPMLHRPQRANWVEPHDPHRRHERGDHGHPKHDAARERERERIVDRHAEHQALHHSGTSTRDEKSDADANRRQHESGDSSRRNG